MWWVDLSQFEDPLIDKLNANELSRVSRLAREGDRRRFIMGVVMLRYSAALHLGIEPAAVIIDRTCSRCGAEHGKPKLAGTALHASVSHSKSLVGVALSSQAPIGLDVQHEDDLDFRAMRSVLSVGEPPPQTRQEFFRYWTRKESVVKATGAGLAVELSRVAVSSPTEAPVLHSYAGHRRDATMMDLDPRPHYAAALTILVRGDIHLVQHWFGLQSPL